MTRSLFGSDPAPTIRVAIVGYGLAGRVIHGQLLSAVHGFEVVAVVSASDQRAALAHADFPEAVTLDSLEELLGNAESLGIHLVVIASPSGLHFEHAMACISYGLNVVVDKPLALNASNAVEIFEQSDLAGVHVFPFQNRRWDSDFVTLMSLRNSNVVGDPLILESNFGWFKGPVSGRWRDSHEISDAGGVLLDLGSHLIDQALLLLGSVESVQAWSWKVRSRNCSDDHVLAVLNHDCGATSKILMSWATAVVTPRFLLLGTLGGVHVDFQDTQDRELRLLRDGIESGAQEGNPRPEARCTMWGEKPRSFGKPAIQGDWGDFYSAAYESLTGGSKFPVSQQETVSLFRVLDRIRYSAESGGKRASLRSDSF